MSSHKGSESHSKETKYKEVDKYEVGPRYGYEGYQLYFPEKDPNIAKILSNTRSFESYIHRHASSFNFPKIKENKAFSVDLKQLVADNEFYAEWEGFREEIEEKSKHCLSCMGMAMHQVIVTEAKSHNNSYVREPAVYCRLINFEPSIPIKDLRANYYGKLVSIQGTVIKESPIKLLCTRMAFSCSICEGVQVAEQIDGIYSTPIKCFTKGCRAHSNFTPLATSSNTSTVNYQSLKVQELLNDNGRDGGRIPRTIECELTRDLVGNSSVGNDVTVVGIVKVRNTNDAGNKGKQASEFLLYIEAVSVTNWRNRASITFSRMDYHAIEKIHATPNLFRHLVQSLCPNIYGHEIVKAGLLLALFGGTHTTDNVRSDSHILVVGDPGLGKSQMLQACSNVAPRGVYVCGNTSTTSGLTVTMTRESGGDFALEAGALILADQGCCCIDEFDKMPTQHACLLEVMEQQTISIAKATVSCNLTARASILAAANPVGGHYNKAKTVAENLKMSSPLLSRFDLVFILLDMPNMHTDKLLSEHVLALHLGKHHPDCGASSSATPSTQVVNETLKDRLKLKDGANADPLPHILLRKYIAYAKKYVEPQLSTDAQKVLKEFYINLRKQYHKGDSTPVTTRQLNSLLRLTQARAKLELREEATANDAIDVVEIMKNSLVDIHSDEKGNLDFTRSQNGAGTSNRKQKLQFLSMLNKKSEAIGRTTFTIKELKELAGNIGIPPELVPSTLDSLNLQGYFLRQGADKYKLIVQ